MHRQFTGWLVALALAVAAPLRAVDIPTAIFIMKTDGSELRRGAQVEGYRKHEAPRWSHDGKRLAFEAREGPDKAHKFFIVNADGTGLKEMGEHGLPDWSPDDKQIVFHCLGAANQKPGIWVQNVDGKGREWLAAGTSPRWSPDGSQLATTNGHALTVLDLAVGGQRNLSDEPSEEILSGFDWSPDGKRLAFVTKNNKRGQLWIVRADSTNPSLRLSGNLKGQVAWSPDGKQLAIGSLDLIQVLNPDDKKGPEPIPGQVANNRDPAWSPDGQWIAFSSDRKTPTLAPKTAQQVEPQRTWKLEEIRRHAKGSIVFGLAFTPDGRRVVMGGDPINSGVQVWDLASDQTQNLGGLGISIMMFPDGRRFATTGLRGAIQIVDVDTGDVTRELEHGDLVGTIALSKDGTRLVSGGLDKLLHVWDVNTGEKICTFDSHTEWITRVIFSPDGKEVISAAHDKTLRVWDAQTGKQRLEVAHPDVIWSLAVSPDGARILTGTGGTLEGNPRVLMISQGQDNALRWWEASSGKLVREMKGHTHVAYTLDISADGRLAVSGSWDKTIRLWNLETGEELHRIEGGKGGVMQVMFSPDGKQVIAGGGVTREVGTRLIPVPDEQIRLYQLVEPPSAPVAK